MKVNAGEKIIYEVKFSLCDAIYIGNAQTRSFLQCQTSSQKWTKSDSFAAYFERHFKSATSCTDLLNGILFELVEKITPSVAMKSFMKLNCNLCM